MTLHKFIMRVYAIGFTVIINRPSPDPGVLELHFRREKSGVVHTYTQCFSVREIQLWDDDSADYMIGRELDRALHQLETSLGR